MTPYGSLVGAREPSFNERDGRLPLLPPSISFALPSLSLARDGRTGIYRVGALAAQIAGLSLSPPVVLVCLLEQRAATDRRVCGQ